ncbi:DUF29 domain-containing protein [Amphibiibacter pelophylacis]|uniref:DUF29 domain-containing protein n=1 Tax=Amphibiibacter pelophylacis TaxID=1799477 RepID=A0ACC6P3Q5_9BURK
MPSTYDADVVAWSTEQAAFLKSGQFDKLDLDNLAEEILDVGKSEKRELASRMAVLLGHLLKWQVQPQRRSSSWEVTIRIQRRAIRSHVASVPSLRPVLADASWIDRFWLDALDLVVRETGIGDLPEHCPWAMADVLTEGWLPAD